MKQKKKFIAGLVFCALVMATVFLQPVYYDFFVYPSKGYIIKSSGVQYTYVATISEGVWRERRFVSMPEADPKTFKVINGRLLVAVDKNFAYFGARKLEDSHGPSFQMVPAIVDNVQSSGYWKDRSNVYRGSIKLKGAVIPPLINGTHK